MRKIFLKKWLSGGLLAVVGLLVIYLLWLLVTLADPADLEKANPQTTALIEQRRREANENGIKFVIKQSGSPILPCLIC
jgi:hypothetical protein